MPICSSCKERDSKQCSVEFITITCPLGRTSAFQSEGHGLKPHLGWAWAVWQKKKMTTPFPISSRGTAGLLCYSETVITDYELSGLGLYGFIFITMSLTIYLILYLCQTLLKIECFLPLLKIIKCWLKTKLTKTKPRQVSSG